MYEHQNVHRIRWWHGLVFFVIAFFLIQFVLSVFVILAKALGFLGTDGVDIYQALLTPTGLSLQVLITCALLMVFAVGLPKIFGVAPSHWLKLKSAKSTLFALSIIGIAGLGFVADEILFLLHRIMPELLNINALVLLNQTFASASPLGFVWLTLVISIGPGVAEEFFFRGFVLRSFQAKMPGWLAVVASAILFGIMHWDGLQGLGAMLIGLFLGFVTLRTGSIWPAVTAHAFNNLLCALFARYTVNPTVETFSQGHPPGILILSIIITVLSLYGIFRITKLNSKDPS
ncbi:MAG: CPBP family intramembrane metalloprotease [Proteobacteria bacterium]|nr:CPBP family intramembrane metalloprotease [Pseudomonadota bacterium]